MERLNTHVGSMQTTLEKRPEVLQAVCVYAAIHVFCSVVNDLVLVLLAQTFVTAHLISEQRGSRVDVLTDDWLQSFLLPIWDDLSANATPTLQDSHDDCFVPEALAHASDSALVHALVHVPRFASDESFVRFHFATKLASEVLILQSEPDAMQHEPCGFLTDLEI